MSFTWILLPTLGFTLFTFIRLNFLSLKSFKTVKDTNVLTLLNSTNFYNHLYYYFIVIFWILIILLNEFFTHNFILNNLVNLNPNTLILVLTTLLFVIAFTSLYLTHLKGVLLSFLMIFSLTTCILLTATNLLQFYIILEILAYTNILFFILFKLHTHTNSNQWLVASIISFLMNFITSIIFFTFIIMWTWRIGYPSWDLLNFFQTNSIESTLFSIFVVTKLGVGPWLVGNYHSYLGYNLYYLIIYTVNMLVVVTPIIISLFFLFGHKWYIILFLIYTYIYLASTLSNVKSIKSLFAYSTVIIYTYLFLICVF